MTLNIPDTVIASLTKQFGDPARAAVESLAAKAYEEGCLGIEGVRQMLSLPSRWEAESLLKSKGVWPSIELEALEHDFAVLDRLKNPA